MPIYHAVLALLHDGPSYGYQLRASFEEAVGPQWGGFNIGHLYQVLERLTRDGYVNSTQVAQTSRPDRRVYELTPSGDTELEQWLSLPADRSAGFRDEFLLKLLAAARLGEREVLHVAARQRRHELARLKSLGQLRREENHSALARLLLEAATLHSQADLEFVDRAEHSAAGLVAQLLNTAADRAHSKAQDHQTRATPQRASS